MKKRRHLGIHAQVLTIAIVPALIVTLILILVVYQGNVRQINRALNQQGQMLVAQLAASLEYALYTGAAEQIPPAIEATVSPAVEVLKTPVKRVIVFDSDNQLLHTAPPIGLSYESLDVFFAWTSSSDDSRTFSAPIYLQPVGFFKNGPQTRRYLGKVQLDISTVPIKAEAFGHLIGDIGLVLGIFASGLLLAHAIGRRLSGTIREAAQAIGRIKAGDWRVHLARIERNELGTLQEGVNLLAESIASAREKLETELAKVRGEYTQTLDELRVQTQEAQKANEAKSLFLAKVSHEMRTPLYSIQGLAEQLLKSRPDADEARIVQTLLKATHHLYQTISDILDFTQLERKRYSPQMTPLDLWHEIENVIETLGPLVSKQNLYLDVIVDPNVPPTVTGDGKAFRTIVTNLISNAIKFTKTGGICISLGVESSQPDWTTSLRLQVSDTGQGIPPENLRTIFAPFEQVEEALDRRYEGTGLGLSIVKGYCKALGGHIDVESDPGQCTTFTVVLPFKVIHANHKLTNLPLAEELIGLHSLVTDERSTFRASVDCRLASLGIRVSEAAISPQALSAMTPPDQPYDLLVVQDLSLRPPEHLPALNDQLLQWAPYILSMNNNDDPAALQQLRQQGVTVALWGGATRKNLQDELITALFGNAPVWPVEQNIFKIQKYLEGKSVLVVEDFDINRSIMTDQLQSNGLVVVEARDGNEAVALASTENLDLILMDIQMPGKDGIQAIKEIRAMPAQAERPIIGFTASADKRTNQRVIEAGANAVLTKPISENELITAIHETLITSASASGA